MNARRKAEELKKRLTRSKPAEAIKLQKNKAKSYLLWKITQLKLLRERKAEQEQQKLKAEKERIRMRTEKEQRKEQTTQTGQQQAVQKPVARMIKPIKARKPVLKRAQSYLQWRGKKTRQTAVKTETQVKTAIMKPLMKVKSAMLWNKNKAVKTAKKPIVEARKRVTEIREKIEEKTIPFKKKILPFDFINLIIGKNAKKVLDNTKKVVIRNNNSGVKSLVPLLPIKEKDDIYSKNYNKTLKYNKTFLDKEFEIVDNEENLIINSIKERIEKKELTPEEVSKLLGVSENLIENNFAIIKEYLNEYILLKKNSSNEFLNTALKVLETKPKIKNERYLLNAFIYFNALSKINSEKSFEILKESIEKAKKGEFDFNFASFVIKEITNIKKEISKKTIFELFEENNELVKKYGKENVKNFRSIVIHESLKLPDGIIVDNYRRNMEDTIILSEILNANGLKTDDKFLVYGLNKFSSKKEIINNMKKAQNIFGTSKYMLFENEIVNKLLQQNKEANNSVSSILKETIEVIEEIKKEKEKYTEENINALMKSISKSLLYTITEKDAEIIKRTLNIIKTFPKKLNTSEIINNTFNVAFKSENPYEFIRICENEEMKRSINRLRFFVGLPEEVINSVLKYTKENELGKKDIKKLNDLCESISILNILKGNIELDRKLSIKENKDLFDKRILEKASELYEKDAFEKKLKEDKDKLMLLVKIHITLKNNLVIKGEDYRKYYEKEINILNEMINKWMKSQEEFEKWKYSDLEKLGFSEIIKKTWKTNDEEKIIIKGKKQDINFLDSIENEKNKSIISKIRKSFEMDKMSYAQEDIQSLLVKFKNNPEITEKLKGVLEEIVNEIGEITIKDEANLIETLEMGEKFGTCTSWSGDNKPYGMIPIAADGTKKMIGVYDKKGNIVGRAFITLSKKEDRKWVLSLHNVYNKYSKNEKSEIINRKIINFARKKAEKLGLEFSSVNLEKGVFINKNEKNYGKLNKFITNDKGKTTGASYTIQEVIK